MSGMFPILMCSFNFTSVWFSWILMQVYSTAGIKCISLPQTIAKMHITKLIYVSQRILLQSTYLPHC